MSTRAETDLRLDAHVSLIEELPALVAQLRLVARRAQVVDGREPDLAPLDAVSVALWQARAALERATRELAAPNGGPAA